MKDLFKNISIPEIITGMESKFYPIFNRYNTTGNLNITLFNFTESIESNFFYNKIYGNSEYIIPASILKLFSVNYFLNIIESNNLLDKQITIGNEIKFLNPTIHKVDLKKGQSYSTIDLIEMALIPSAGDAVYTLSRVVYNIFKNNHWNDSSWLINKDDWLEMLTFVCSKIRDYYRTSLNINATILDPTGIQREILKVQDIGTLVNFLINSNSKILNIVAKSQTSKINGRTWNSTNAFVRKDKSYYHPKIKGLKTGSLSGWKNLFLLYQLTPTNNVGILVAGCENHSDTKEIANLIIKELDNKLFNISFEKNF